MKRFTQDNPGHTYDLVIVGGGIYGASMAYTASLNGLNTLLLEKDDFGAHTSANSQKVIHGGLRYLQSFDIKRVIESIHEKQRFYHLFPHQVKPLPCLLPTSGFTMKGNEAFRIAFFLYGLLEKIVSRKKLKKNLNKRPEILSRQQVCERFPHMENMSFRGGALWHDGICIDPERVILSLLRGAVKLGCATGNYMKVESITRRDSNSVSLRVHDKEENRNITVNTKKVALCTGSWFKDAISPAPLPSELDELHLIRGVNLVVDSLFKSKTSFATKVESGDSSRFLFIVPWKEYSIEGTHWEDCTDPSQPWATEQQVTTEFHGITQGAIGSPAPQPSVHSKHIGFVPGTLQGVADASERILPHYRLVDREQNKNGDILQVVGVKFTTAFDVVLKALRQLFPDATIKDVLQFNNLPEGSHAEESERLFSLYRENYRDVLSYEQCRMAFTLFGSELPRIVQQFQLSKIGVGQPVNNAVFYKSLARHCVSNEMTLHLDDLIFRRLFPDTPIPISSDIMNTLADEMAELLHWSDIEKENELKNVIHQYG